MAMMAANAVHWAHLGNKCTLEAVCPTGSLALAWPGRRSVADAHEADTMQGCEILWGFPGATLWQRGAASHAECGPFASLSGPACCRLLPGAALPAAHTAPCPQPTLRSAAQLGAAGNTCSRAASRSVHTSNAFPQVRSDGASGYMHLAPMPAGHLTTSALPTFCQPALWNGCSPPHPPLPWRPREMQTSHASDFCVNPHLASAASHLLGQTAAW